MKNSLDQFYTKPEIAATCWEHFTDTLVKLNRNPNDMFFIEPAAGNGVFYKLLPQQRRLGIDLVPKCDDVKPQDFFELTDLRSAPRETAIIGNPPFGKRGKLAIAFFNHAARLADTVAFIVPVNSTPTKSLTQTCTSSVNCHYREMPSTSVQASLTQ